jgi:hypothetical protein
MKVNIILNFTPEAILTGISVAIFLPIIAMVSPIINELTI